MNRAFETHWSHAACRGAVHGTATLLVAGFLLSLVVAPIPGSESNLLLALIPGSLLFAASGGLVGIVSYRIDKALSAKQTDSPVT